jgi:hypothetical protein
LNPTSLGRLLEKKKSPTKYSPLLENVEKTITLEEF